MPLKSEAQRRKFHLMASRGEISPHTVKKWEAETPKGKLPERLHKKAEIDYDQILWAGFFDELEKDAVLGAAAKAVWGATKAFGRQAWRVGKRAITGKTLPGGTWGGAAKQVKGELGKATKHYGRKIKRIGKAELRPQL